jgi:hypothetical protein
MPSQKFDVLDGLEITGDITTDGGITAAANVAIDTNVLFVDTIANRVGINTVASTGKILQVAVPTGEAAAISSTGGLVTEASYWSAQDRARFGFNNGSVIIDDKNTSGSTTNKDLEINLNNIQRARFDPSANTISLTGDVNITAPTGGGLDVDATGTSESVFHAASDSTGSGAVAARWMYTNFIEAYNEKDATSCGIAIGAITGGTAANGTDEISMITNGFQVANFQTGSILLNKAVTLAANENLTLSGTGVLTSPTISATANIALADTLYHTGDTNTYLKFASADTIQIATNGTVRLTANTNGMFATTMTANTAFQEKVHDGGTGTAYTLNVNNGPVHKYAPTGAYSIDFSNFSVSGATRSFSLVIDNGGSAKSATWPGSGEADAVFWADGIEPPAGDGVDIYYFVCIDGQIYGSLGLRNAGFAN